MTDEQKEIQASKAAQKLAEEHDLDLAAIDGTGADGAITKPDVEKAIEAANAGPKRYLAKLRGRYPFASIAVPGCDPSVVIPRSGTVVSAEAKAAFEKAAKDDAFPVSKDDVVFTEL